MYAFRKPFVAAQFGDVAGWTFPLDYKSTLLIAQVLGYALSKFIGIKVISEIGRRGRAWTIFGLVAASWAALILFALVPAPWNVFFLFLNGLPLGMIWGLVFSYLEGRRTTDVLGAIMCTSLIVSSGLVKSVGSWLMLSGVSEYWMPAAAAALFFPLLWLSLWILEQVPPPTPEDEAARVKRVPMMKADRATFFRRYGLGLALLVFGYLLLTAMRDFRDNFAAEIWTAMGFAKDPAVFSQSELPIGVVVLGVLGALVLIRNNKRALLVMHGVIIVGALLIAGATAAFQAGLLSPLAWMILTGAGMYFGYAPFNAMLFDRMIAALGSAGNAGFLIYVADASGYVGSVALLLYRKFGAAQLDWLSFYEGACYAIAALLVLLIGASGLYHARTIQEDAHA